jgi:drug/metabolite transporter (DMT)-like permease
MGLALALVAAVSWGSSDYIAGQASRRTTALAVAAFAQLTGLALVSVLAPLVPGAPTAGDLGWGALAGAASATGLVALYRGLAIGPMSIVAPATAAMATVFPVLIGVAVGQSLSATALGGVILAIAAIVALSMSSEPDLAQPAVSRLRRAAPLILIAGIGFGAFFVALDQTGAHAGLWPLVAARVASVSMLWPPLLARRGDGVASAAAPGVAAGALDIAAASAALLAFRHQSLPIVAVISSLYPAATVTLAGLMARERLGAGRLVWCALAVLAVMLVAVS